MKKIIALIVLPALLWCSCEKEKAELNAPCQARATMSINVTVKDYSFEPATVNAIPGDTIVWTLQTGANPHTTTSTSLPAGASPWDAPIDDNSSANHTFKYVVPVNGTYHYQCTIHGTSMSGTIIASPPC